MAPSKTGLRKQLESWTDMTDDTQNDDPSGAADATGSTGSSGKSARGTGSSARGRGRGKASKGSGSSTPAKGRGKKGIGSSGKAKPGKPAKKGRPSSKLAMKAATAGKGSAMKVKKTLPHNVHTCQWRLPSRSLLHSSSSLLCCRPSLYVYATMYARCGVPPALEYLYRRTGPIWGGRPPPALWPWLK